MLIQGLLQLLGLFLMPIPVENQIFVQGFWGEYSKATFGLNGPVESYEDEDSRPEYRTGSLGRVVFNRNGQVIEHYDISFRRFRLPEQYSDYEERTLLTYDRLGRLTEARVFGRNNILENYATYKYTGNRLSELRIDWPDKGADGYSPSITSFEYLDEKRTVIQTTEWYGNKSKFTHEFDEQNRLLFVTLQEQKSGTNQFVMRYKSTYIYPDQQTKVYADVDLNGKVTPKLVWKYDQKGNLVEEVSYTTTGQVKEKTVYKNECSYDHFDNWTECIFTETTDSTTFTTISKRKIKYFD